MIPTPLRPSPRDAAPHARPPLRSVAVPFPSAAASAAVRDIRGLGYTDIRLDTDGEAVVVTGSGIPGVRFTPLRPTPHTTRGRTAARYDRLTQPS